MTPTRIFVLVSVSCAQIIAPRVADWPKELPLPPWKLIKSSCHKCGAEVYLTEDYLDHVLTQGFKEVKIVCVHCAARGPRIAA